MAEFGDIRLDRRLDWLMDRIVSTGSVVLRRIGETRAGELAAHRFLDNERISPAGILSVHSERTGIACRGRRIVAVQDTTEINFSGRDAGRHGLGAGGNGKALGFFVHPVIAVDLDDEAVLGVVDAQIWSRGTRALVPRRERCFEDKESHRWLTGATRTAACLATAAQRIMVADREADIYPLFARRPASVDLVIRLAHDRALADGGHLVEAMARLPERGEIEVQVRAKPGQNARTARLSLRCGPITLARPRHDIEHRDPETLRLNVVESTEIDPPKGCKPLNWRLLTSLPVAMVAEAEEVVQIYRLRWRIEEIFRALKSNGLKLEDTQVEAADRLFNLAAMAMVAASRIIQLVDARDGGPRPASDVIGEELLAPAAAIGKTLEGKTKRQKNPHQKGSLAWLGWIVARLGGWNCYYKPPGTKTMATGWNQLAAMLTGAVIIQHKQNV